MMKVGITEAPVLKVRIAITGVVHAFLPKKSTKMPSSLLVFWSISIATSSFLFKHFNISFIAFFFNGCVILKKNAMKEILKCLKRNKFVEILREQNTSRDEGIFVDFFGKKACTTPVIAILTLRTGASVIPTFIIREDAGKIRVIFEEEVEIIPSSDYRKDIEKYTAIFTKIIESVIRRYPDQWLWLHRRWKTQL